MVAPLVWQSIPQVVNVGANALAKPKREDFQPNLQYIKNYMASKKGEKLADNIYEMAIRPAVRQIGAAGRQKQREIDYAIERNDPGFGAEAQARLSAGRQTEQAMERASEDAARLQAQEDRRLDAQIDRAELQMGRMQSQADTMFRRAMTNWRNSMITSTAQAAGNIAGAIGQQFESDQAALEAAKVEGLVDPETTIRQFRQQAKGAGLTDTRNYAQKLAQDASEAEVQRAIDYYAGDRVDEIPDDIPQEERLKVARQFATEREQTENLYNKMQLQFDQGMIQSMAETMTGEQDIDVQDAIQRGEIDPQVLINQVQGAQNMTYNNLRQKRDDLTAQDIEANAQNLTEEAYTNLYEQVIKNKENELSDFEQGIVTDYLEGSGPEELMGYLDKAENRQEFNQAANLIEKAQQRLIKQANVSGEQQERLAEQAESQRMIIRTIGEMNQTLDNVARNTDAYSEANKILQKGTQMSQQDYRKLQDRVKELSQHIEPPSEGDAEDVDYGSPMANAIMRDKETSPEEKRQRWYNTMMDRIDRALRNVGALGLPDENEEPNQYPNDPLGDLRVK